MDASLRQRLLSAAIYLPVVIVFIVASPWTFALLLAVAAFLGGRELASLFGRLGWLAPPFLPVAAVLTFGLSLAGGLGPVQLILTALAWLLGLIWLFVPLVPSRAENTPGTWLVHLLGALYLGLLLAFWARLAGGPWTDGMGHASPGPRWVFYALALTLLCDTGAYAAGRMWGRSKLWVQVSPKKTWEGAVGGLVTSVLAGSGLSPLVPGLTIAEGALIGAAVGIAAPFGDLIESRLKRKAMVKDAGGLIPGHGGMLDRLDSLLFVAPLFYYGLYRLAG